MAWVRGTLILVVIFFTFSYVDGYDINQHTCRHVADSLLCDWQGTGIYQVDRSLPTIKSIVFARMSKECRLRSRVDVRRNVPDLETVKVESGNIRCENILTPVNVITTIHGMKCVSDSTTPGMMTPDVPKTEILKDGFSKTTIKLQVEASEGALPIISIRWEDLLQIRILIVTVLVAIFFGWKMCTKKRQYRRRRATQNRDSRTDMTGNVVEPRRSPRTRH